MTLRTMAISEEQVRGVLTEVFEDDLHVKRIVSLAHATLGVVQATSLSVAAIGKAIEWARGEDVSKPRPPWWYSLLYQPKKSPQWP